MANATETYERIVKLEEEGVWVPAQANGGLRKLLREMIERGWSITPPGQYHCATCANSEAEICKIDWEEVNDEANC